MDFEQEQALVEELKKYVHKHVALSAIEKDEVLEEKIEEIVNQHLVGRYCSIEQRLSIIQQVFSAFRGYGILDTIMSDDTITEVMINGHKNIFIEQNGRLFKLDKQFEKFRKQKNPTRLQFARTKIQGQAFQNIHEDADIYLMSMPTGSGKTLCSAKCS